MSEAENIYLKKIVEQPNIRPSKDAAEARQGEDDTVLRSLDMVF